MDTLCSDAVLVPAGGKDEEESLKPQCNIEYTPIGKDDMKQTEK